MRVRARGRVRMRVRVRGAQGRLRMGQAHQARAHAGVAAQKTTNARAADPRASAQVIRCLRHL
jgi:hypothetical protein